MKRCAHCGRENWDDAISCRTCEREFDAAPADTKPQPAPRSGAVSLKGLLSDMGLEDLKARRWLWYVGLGVAAVALALFLSRGGLRTSAPGIVVLAAYSSNGEQVVTFRTDPADAQVTSAELVPDSYNETTQPATVRQPGYVHPVPTGGKANLTLHFVALPGRGASIGGRPLAYTPGSYTLAYTPTESAHRVRIGVALEESGIRDYQKRLRYCWVRKSLRPLGWKTLRDPRFVTTEAFTNAAPGGAKP